MTMNVMATLGILAAGLFAQDPATGADTALQDGEWTRTVVTEGDDAASAVHPVDETRTGALLQCTGNSMTVFFAVEPLNFDELAESQTSRARKWTGKLFIDGEMVDEREWVYLPALKAAWPGSKATAAKVFNAIVKGQTVEFEVGRKDRVRVYLPKPDEAFSAFAADCASYREAAE